MSVSGIASTALPQFGNTPIIQPNRRQSADQIGRELEQDLQNGDLAGAQQAYQQLAQFGSSNMPGPFNGGQMAAEFRQLGQDLQSGNLAAAQSDNSTLTTNLLKQDVAAVERASKGGSQNSESLQTAMANFQGDYWAVYGQQPSSGDLQTLEGGTSTTPISVQA